MKWLDYFILSAMSFYKRSRKLWSTQSWISS